MPAVRLVPLVLLVAACAMPPGERWERPADHALPSVSESGYCRDEARRQALMRYPDQPPREERGLPRIEDEHKFPAELRFYEQCMTRSGFVRVSAPTN